MSTILVLFFSCDKDEGPDAFFINEIKFKKVQFMDLSREGDGNIIRWEWDLGDGSTSTDKHPLHTYSKMDTSYSVRLVVTDENDLSDIFSKDITWDSLDIILDEPEVNFEFVQNILWIDSLEVKFTDASKKGDGDIKAWSWNFGDGNGIEYDSVDTNFTGTASNDNIGWISTLDTTTGATTSELVHIYILTPAFQDTEYSLEYNYNVSLTVTDEFDTTYTLDSLVLLENPAFPIADFSPNVDGLTATFTSTSTPAREIVKYSWNFGDTTTIADTSQLPEPSYTYLQSGFIPHPISAFL